MVIALSIPCACLTIRPADQLHRTGADSDIAHPDLSDLTSSLRHDYKAQALVESGEGNHNDVIHHLRQRHVPMSQWCLASSRWPCRAAGSITHSPTRVCAVPCTACLLRLPIHIRDVTGGGGWSRARPKVNKANFRETRSSCAIP